jgi:hypothetical protein
MEYRQASTAHPSLPPIVRTTQARVSHSSSECELGEYENDLLNCYTTHSIPPIKSNESTIYLARLALYYFNFLFFVGKTTWAESQLPCRALNCQSWEIVSYYRYYRQKQPGEMNQEEKIDSVSSYLK